MDRLTASKITRRHALFGSAGLALQALVPDALAQTAAPRSEPMPAALPRLSIYIPAGTGGGWDQTGRSLGRAVQASGLAQQVVYENKGGKGGTVGLADFVTKHRGDPSALLVSGMVMVGAIAVNRTPVTLQQVTPIARLTSDYLVLVTPANSPYRTMKALSAAIRDNLAKVAFCGGSAGGVDHMLAGMIARTLRADPVGLQYHPTSSGKEAIELLHSGKATVAISGYSEFKAGIEDRSLVALAVSSRRSLFGVPSLREQGVDTELSNWRGVFAPAGLTEGQKQHLRQVVVRATESPVWRQALADNNWLGTTLHGKPLADFLEIEDAIANAVTLMLKLKPA